MLFLVLQAVTYQDTLYVVGGSVTAGVSENTQLFYLTPGDINWTEGWTVKAEALRVVFPAVTVTKDQLFCQ